AAVYGGDGSFATSIGSLLGGQTVYKTSTTVALSSSVNPSVWGQTVTFTAVIYVTAPGAGTPSGTVQFQIDGSNAGNPVSVSVTGGVLTASFTSATLAVGAHALAASYGGDDSFFGSSAAYVNRLAVNKASATTTLASSASPSV